MARTTYILNSNHVVNIVGNNSSPQTINIRTGDTITWINDGGFHNVNGQLSDYPNNPEGFGNNVSSSLYGLYSMYLISLVHMIIIAIHILV